ncbi:MAG: T9SS C-terminal target domain-containing protein [Bacteroidetes bacterium]|nr:MAG: T9SS C-terminal target domain-containing protein [Bacteroidota bacterium]
MKQLILSLLFFAGICSTGTAQVTITADLFPTVGDTLRTAVDNLPENITITPPGGGQTWNYSSLNAPFEVVDVYRDAAEGSVFSEVSDADVLLETAQVGESYYKVTANAFELVAVNGGGQIGLNLNTLIRFNPPLIERHEILTFPQQDVSTSHIFVAMATDDLPQEILDLLDLPLLPDSIRLNIETERSDFVDAWGTMTIPGGTYDVVRFKRTQTNNIMVEALVPIIGWTDVTDLVAPFLDNFGNGTTVSYHFLSDQAKEPIAVVTMNADETQATQVIFKSNDIFSGLEERATSQPNVYAYPNPAIFDTRFEFANLPKGIYTLRIYNILGVPVWEQKYDIAGSRTVKVQLDTFSKGTYLYSLISPKGKTLMTKRLMIVRP